MTDAGREANHYLRILQNSEQDWRAAEAALPQLRAAWEQIPKDDLNTLWAWATVANTFFKRRGHWPDKIAWVEAAQVREDLERVRTALRAQGGSPE